MRYIDPLVALLRFILKLIELSEIQFSRSHGASQKYFTAFLDASAILSLNIKHDFGLFSIFAGTNPYRFGRSKGCV